MVGFLIGRLGQQDVQAPVVGDPVEDVVGVQRALVIDVQLIEVGGIFQVVLVSCRLQVQEISV